MTSTGGRGEDRTIHLLLLCSTIWMLVGGFDLHSASQPFWMFYSDIFRNAQTCARPIVAQTVQSDQAECKLAMIKIIFIFYNQITATHSPIPTLYHSGRSSVSGSSVDQLSTKDCRERRGKVLWQGQEEIKFHQKLEDFLSSPL